MTLTSSRPFTQRCRRTVAGLAMAAVCASASALPAFTLDPAAASLAGTSFTADNILISDFSTVRFNRPGHFTDTGFLAVSALELGGTAFSPTGLNDTSGNGYGMYFAFTGAGDTTAGRPATDVTVGHFTTLTYTLYGYNGVASFGFDASNNPTTTAAGGVVLGSGSLISGTVSTIPTGDGTTFTPSAAATLTFAAAPGREAFFVNPKTFFSVAFSAFTNTLTQVQAFDGGFRIFQGGGAVNFAQARPISEPASYALMLAGLAAAGFVTRRRRHLE